MARARSRSRVVDALAGSSRRVDALTWLVWPVWLVWLAWLAIAVTATSGCGSSATGSSRAAVAPAGPAPPAPSIAPVAPASPPRDDGQSSEGGEGGSVHAAALEELRVGPLGWRADRQNSLRLPLPDWSRWLRVKFWGVKTLVGFRYGKDHHAIVGGTLVHVPDELAPGACSDAFERDARPWVDSFEVSLDHEPPQAIPWNGKIVDIDSLVATTATLFRDRYAVAYATYPAWKGTCVVVGVAVPARGELARAKAVRDRFIVEVLPKLVITSKQEPRELY